MKNIVAKIYRYLQVAVITLCLLAGFMPKVPLSAEENTGPLQKLAEIQPASGYEEVTEYALAGIIGKVVSVFLGLLGIIFIVLMLYAGWKWMTAAGDESKVTDAKETITRAIIGLIITVGSYAIWNLIFTYFISA